MYKVLTRLIFLCSLLISLWLFYIQGMQPLIPASWLKWSDQNERYLIYLRPGDATNLDPAQAVDRPSAQVLANIFEGLVRLEPDGSRVQPCLAKSWDISSDGLQWTFHLRPGVKFHDGTPCDSQAVKFSVERVINGQGQSPSPYATFVYGVIKSISTPDALTVRFTLKYPYAPFLHNLAMPLAAPVVSPAAAKKYGPAFAQHPVGTGPFMLQNWIRGKEIILAANPAYWGQKPNLPGIIFRTEAKETQRIESLTNGTADVVEDLNPSQLPSLTGAGYHILRNNGQDVGYLGFYTNKKPFNDPRIRIAACRAIDPAVINGALFAGKGISANGPLPPGIQGYDPSIKQYSFNLERSRQELAEAGYPQGINITLITYTNKRPYNPAGGVKLATTIAEQLERAGFHCQIKSYPWEEYKKALYRGEGDTFLYGWTGDNWDPDNFLYTLLASPQISCGLNASRYHNREVDTLLLTAQRTADPESRAKIYRDAQQIITHDAPLYFINHSLLLLATDPKIYGLSMLPGGIPLLYKVHRQ